MKDNNTVRFAKYEALYRSPEISAMFSILAVDATFKYVRLFTCIWESH